jgi:hypothetical protein
MKIKERTCSTNIPVCTPKAKKLLFSSVFQQKTSPYGAQARMLVLQICLIFIFFDYAIFA